MQDYDAVVIGAGINGMVAAAQLAGAGWSVALIDERDRIGGFIASEELTLPGFVHDTFSSWHPLFLAGAAYADLGPDLHRHGLEYVNTDGAVTATVGTGGTVIAQRDAVATAADLPEAADRAAYAQLLADMEAWAPHVFGVLGSELTDRTLGTLGFRALRGLGRKGVDGLARAGLQSGRAACRERFVGPEVDALWSPWLLHTGLSPDHASGGVMLPVMAFSMHAIGLPIVRGGAGHFTAAFERLLINRGVHILLNTPVTRIVTRSGRAIGVDAGGRHLGASRAVLASTSTPALYNDLLDGAVVGDRQRRAARTHRPGRAAMQVHLALDGPVPWTDARLAEVPLIHLCEGSDSVGIACAEAEAGMLPGRPTVVVGQQCVLDPSRAPEGKATLWIQLQEVPWSPRSDAAGSIPVAGEWTEEVTAAYVERVLERIEEFAPGFRSSVLAVAPLPPTALAAANRNAVQGDPYGGAAELDHNLLWRPGTGNGHDTGVEGLFHIGAFTHPGPGLGGGSGSLVATRLTQPSPLSRLFSRKKL